MLELVWRYLVRGLVTSALRHFLGHLGVIYWVGRDDGCAKAGAEGQASSLCLCSYGSLWSAGRVRLEATSFVLSEGLLAGGSRTTIVARFPFLLLGALLLFRARSPSASVKKVSALLNSTALWRARPWRRQ